MGSVLDIFEELTRLARTEEAIYHSLPAQSQRDATYGPLFDHTLLLKIVSSHTPSDLDYSNPAAWDRDRWTNMYTLVHLTGSSRVFFLSTATLGARIDPATVRYEYDSTRGWWRRDPAAPLDVNIAACRLYVLGHETPRYSDDMTRFPAQLLTWNALDRVLGYTWYLSRPLHAPGITELHATPHSQLGQLAQLMHHSRPLPATFFEIDNELVSDRAHVRLNLIGYDETREDARSPPDLEERVLLLDRAPEYGSALLEDLYRALGLAPTRHLGDVLIGGGERAYDLVLLEPQFVQVLVSLGVSIVLFMDVADRADPSVSAEDALRAGTPDLIAMQILFLTQRAMTSAAPEAAWRRAMDAGNDLMHWDRADVPSGARSAWLATQKFEDSMDVEDDSERHAQLPDAYQPIRENASAPSSDEPATQLYIRLPSPLPSSDSDSEATTDMPG